MTTYTTVADSNGDFIVPFSTEYSSGEKVTVTAEKDGAIKTIELFAPSEVTGGGVIQFSGTLNDFPNNVGVVEFSADINGSIASYGFYTNPANRNFGYYATGLKLNGVTLIDALAFYGWENAKTLELPETLTRIQLGAFQNWKALQTLVIPNSVTRLDDAAFRDCTVLSSVTLGTNVSYIGSAFYQCSSLMNIICLASTPPQLDGSALAGVPVTCNIFVPESALNLYKAAPSWSARASYIQAI
ncbi:leucine-rich repeat domain-containing protein [Acinetobacter radioresistens]|uniref:leucine-rich repeat domain-containing protein n=1 Tax=Acinetobacter radioresistens TaxID=40216 RepID=UPI002003B460|nr:leucine-rich repeat domain-containing protein [Acinetobacter radioresistens]MCK4099727.1 leucine-rich repeat domain-containing protein [Acinetobacter radioresistens]